jgi:phosphoribosylamine---glycine ligase
MKILVIGSGGREHAFAWKLGKSPLVDKVFVAPGNAGTATVAENVAIGITEFDKIAAFCLEENIELVVVGPEAPLVEGIVDYFRGRQDLKDIFIIGPDKTGAQLEGSKDFSKAFMVRHGVPTASSRTFTADSLEEGLAYVGSHSLPVVLKADGLAAGKGVIIAESNEEARDTLKEMLVNKKFGEASAKVVVEQFLKGIELSVFILADGRNYVILPEAKDYKRIGEGDAGPNTGGMGAVSPVPFADAEFMKKVEEKVIKPTVNGLIKEGIDYTGFIFFGLMNVNGEPFVIEYNARMGDPETEVVLPRIQSDLAELLLAAGKKQLESQKVVFDKRAATTVMLVSGGYPDDYDKGKEIAGLEKVSEVIAFHAGTSVKDGKVVTNGGRVIAVTGMDSDWEAALSKSNQAAAVIEWDKKYYRKDIGFDLKVFKKVVF